jgi:hypothetical protein
VERGGDAVADTILEIVTQNDSGQPLSIKVTAEEMTRTRDRRSVDELDVTLIADGDPVGVISFDPATGSLHVSGLSLTASGYVTCLAACGLGHLVADILDCWRRKNTTVKKLLACLKKKGHRLTMALITCAVSCLAGGP